MDSKIGLIIQLGGVSLIALLTLFLRRSISVVALRHWTNAWLLLCVALFCLRLSFSYEEYSTQLFSFYFLTEYLFGFLVVAGCRSLAGNQEMRSRHEAFVLPFVVIAFGLPFLGDDFNLIFNIHALIISGFFAYAFIALWRAKLGTFGSKMMLVALGVLITDFFQYFLVFSIRQYYEVDFAYLAYDPIIDLTCQVLLGFGMVIVLLERVLADVRTANEQLKKAHERLKEIAHVDPLTRALNRHAFYGYLNRKDHDGDVVYGCVGFFDIDDLKTVNDVYGHIVGDSVIRRVVRAIRTIIRAEDLIFRWGGDEFFVIMIGMDAVAANARMARLDDLLSNIQVDGVPHLLSIGVSHAFADFADLTDLEMTIKRADEGIYLQKKRRKGLAIEDHTGILVAA